MKDEKIEIIDTREKEYIEFLIDEKNIDVVKDDKKLLEINDINSIKLHNEHYNNLLENYVRNSKANLKMKFILKIIFFVMCAIILIGLFIFLISTSWYCLKEEISIESTIAVMLTNIISFLTSFIVLPQTIASYLFDSSEEANSFEIIKNIQDYDKDVRNRL